MGGSIDVSVYLNSGGNKLKQLPKSITFGNKLENAIVEKSKVDILSIIFKSSVQKIRYKNKKIDIVFLIDSSSSVGKDNFLSEIKFVRKLLGDFTVSYNHTRVAIVTFSSQGKIIRHIDQITTPKEENDKCKLLNYEMPNIQFVGGGTYTFGALREAKDIFVKARKHSKKLVFLITDGFSNGRNPVPIAQKLKNDDITIITFGIQTGNYAELYNISTYPGEEHSFLLDSFMEFESLARKALHNDYKVGHSVRLKEYKFCDILCDISKDNQTLSCCDENAECTCGTTSGHYSCICAPGYYGSGLRETCQLCPNGTYWHWNVCKPCPDINHITKIMPAVNISFCQCKTGFKPRDNNRCEVITCPRLKAPENGYFVKHPSGCGHVLNAACGARCKSGYQLTGSSIRLCQENSTWSGNEANCVLKTCPRLPIPYYGMVTCKNIDLNQFFDYTPRNQTFMKIYHNDEMRITEPMPIDTDCNFKCGPGFYMVGSGMRNCLPLSKWDGLQTTCKQILCTPLPVVNFGEYDPTDCTNQKVSHGTNCTLICQHGFDIKGPLVKSCGGKRTGVWINRNKYPKCVDVMPPDIICPKNLTVPMLDTDNYAIIKSFPPPNVTDNSNLDVTYWLKPAFKPDGLRLTLGDHVFTYVTIDSFKNKAKCNFTVTVIDMTPPIIDNCINPIDIYIPVSPSANRNDTFIDWDDPIIYDNSNTDQLFVNKSHQPGYLGIGLHQIHYIAIDPSTNQNECIMNVTVNALKCNALDSPLNGHALCAKNLTHTWCHVSCNDGYGIYDDNQLQNLANQPDIEDTYLEDFKLYCENDYPKWKYEILPDCTILEMPNTIEQIFSISLDSDQSICNDGMNSSTNPNNLNVEITEQLKLQLCGDQSTDDCEMVTDDLPDCLELESLKISNNISNTSFYSIISKRDVSGQLMGGDVNSSSTTPLESVVISATPSTGVTSAGGAASRKERVRHKTNMKIKIYTRIGKKLGIWNKNNSRTANLRLVKTEIQNLNGNAFLQRKLNELKINIKILKLDEIITCKNGSVSKKHVCVQCPRGTFHNDVLNVCQVCPLNSYNTVSGQMDCLKCPENYSTRKPGSKFLTDCIQQCPPGTIAKIKMPRTTIRAGTNTKYIPAIMLSTSPQKSLMPFCRKCFPGEYQPLYDQITCKLCPENYTSARGTINASECYPKRTLPCSLQPSICGHHGTCISEQSNNYLYSCLCEENFIGSHCEQQIDLCQSAPCQNGGTCLHIENNTTAITCVCPTLFKGDFCELNYDQCTVNICKNNGLCIETPNGQSVECECMPGYEGEFCEIEINYCASSPCDSGTCHNRPEGYHCECPPGIIGRRCHLRPCDYLPCHRNAICIDLLVMNAIRSSYVCQCPRGLRGHECLEIDNPCDSNPCRNNGVCAALYLRDPLNAMASTNDESWYGRFRCQCSPYFYGEYCETFTIPDFVMEFTKSGVSNFVQIEGPKEDLHELSFCSWIQTNDSFNYGTVISYATESSDNMFTFTDYNGFVLYINGSNIITDIQINDNMWHFVCMSWMSENGFYEIYVDGNLRNTGYNLSANSLIESNGTLILGQEQDHEGTAFSESESFIGKLAYLDIWNRFLAGREVLEYYMSCEPYQGNLYSWTDFKHRIKGIVKVLPSPFCKPCNRYLTLANGYIRNNGNTAAHFCYEGYKLHGPVIRQCLRSSQWSQPEPFCKSIKCEFIPNIFNGHTIIERNSFGDKVTFSCNDGFALNGPSSRICLSNGTWSNVNPECISSVKCQRLPLETNKNNNNNSNNNNNIKTIIIYANEKGPVSELSEQFPIGTFAEIQCTDENAQISGENFLTCLESGSWDFTMPECMKKIISDEKTTASDSSMTTSPATMVLKIPHSTTGENENTPTVFFWTNFIKLINYGCLSKSEEENDDSKYSELCYLINKNPLNDHSLKHHTTQQTSEKIEIHNMDDKLLECLQRFERRFSNSPDLISFENLFENILYAVNDDDDVEGEKGDRDHSSEIRFSIATENSLRFLLCYYIETLIIDHIIIISNEPKPFEYTNNSGTTTSSANIDHQQHITIENIRNVLIKIGNHFYRKYFDDLLKLELSERMEKFTNTNNGPRLEVPPKNSVIELNIVKKCDINKIGKIPMNSRIQLIRNANDHSIIFNSSIDKIELNTFKSLSVNTKVYFSCINDRFEFFVSSHTSPYTECTNDGIWSKIEFNCQEICNRPRLSMNMEQNINKDKSDIAIEYYPIGYLYELKCIDGYALYGPPPASIECQSNGIWTKIRSQCSKISCNKPKIPLDSLIISGSSYLYMDKLLIECSDKTVTEIQCQYNGKWTPGNLC